MSQIRKQLTRCLAIAACCAWSGCGGASSLVGGGSLADVVLGADGFPQDDASQPVPGAMPADSAQGVARARVRNESVSRQVDVTVRFIRDDVVVRLAFVRVASETATTVLSPEAVDSVELSGVDSDGSALTGAVLVFGRDFDESNPAEYVIFDDRVEIEIPDLVVPVDDVQVRPIPEEPSTIQLLEPAIDAGAFVGSTVTVRWSDFAGSAGSVVRLFLRAVGTDALISVGPAMNAALDGLNDEFRIVLGGIAPGVYEVLAEIDNGREVDGRETATSVAPGRLTVVAPAVGQNAPPSLTIVTPVASSAPLMLAPGESFEVTWEDGDADDNATIVFTLQPSDPLQVGLGVFQVSPPFAEDLDGPAYDGATLSVGGVLPGLYDLVGTITDGSLSDIARVSKAILVREQIEIQNDLPSIAVLQPSADLEVPVGGSFFVRWTDQDMDQDARISLYLDPASGGIVFDGDEILLTNSISEDVDGPGDEIQIGITSDFARGEYYLVAVIFDGTDEAVARAPGIVVVVDASGGGRIDPDLDPDTEDDNSGGQTVTMLDPLYDVTRLTVSTFSLAIPTSGVVVSDSIPRSVLLTNEPYGGDTTVEFVPTQWLWESQDGLRVAVPRDLVPNAAWPRSFEVRLRLTDGLGTEHELVSPGPMWLPQEVEVLDATALSYSCDSSGNLTRGDARFVGLAIEWFGGGLLEGEPHADVEFWLSSDGIVPAGGYEDATHRLIWRSAGSPNVTRTAYIGIEVINSGILGDIEAIDTGPPGGTGAVSLDPGNYHLLAVVELEGGGRLTAPAYPTTVSVCRPDSSAGPSE